MPLLERRVAAFEPRSAFEIDLLLKAAYGAQLDVARISRGLIVAADALGEGDLSHAMVAALQLRLPPLDDEGAARIVRADALLTKYAADQPRDWHGRWTTEPGGDARPEDRRRWPAGPVGGMVIGGKLIPGIQPYDPSQPEPEAADDGPHGGRLVYIQEEEPEEEPAGIGDNGPPGPTERPRSESAERWGVPDGGVPVDTDNPRLPDGSPWPQPSHELLLHALAVGQGRPPTMTLFTPLDGEGPLLVGSTNLVCYPLPKGYEAVRWVGTPQVTIRGGMPTRHGWDGVDEALGLAKTNQFSEIFFNRAFATATGQLVQSRIRPDVLAIVRPGLAFDHLYHPYESLSPGQRAERRQAQMPSDPRVGRMDWRAYKRARRLSRFFRLLRVS